MTPSAAAVSPPHVEACLDYLTATSRVNRPTLDRHGFTLARHPSAVLDFRDAAEVAEVYPAEVIQTVRDLTGADRVVPT